MNSTPSNPSAASDSADSILARAAGRAAAKSLPYFGEVTPTEAWQLMRSGAGLIVDVRTLAEWTYVGRVDGTPLVEWRPFGAQQVNPDFIKQLGEQAGPDIPVMFLCRSGVRSHAAAQLAAQTGYGKAMNILEGFEGDLDQHGHRGLTGGWRKVGLPWVQS